MTKLDEIRKRLEAANSESCAEGIAAIVCDVPTLRDELNDHAPSDLALLLSIVERQREALAFYAQPENYQGANQDAVDGEPSRAGGYRLDVTFDAGMIARECIAEVDKMAGGKDE